MEQRVLEKIKKWEEFKELDPTFMSLRLFQSTYQSHSLVASPSLENIKERYESPLDM